MADTTLIITTHERPQYLRRLTEFLAQHEYPIIVIDSSAQPHEHVLPDGVRYHHRTDLYFTEKVLAAVGMVDTPFAAICADDDFLVPAGIEAAAAFLTANLGYVSAQGLTMAYLLPEPGVAWFAPKYEALALRCLDLNFTAPTAEARLLSSFQVFMQWIYGVHRTEALRSTAEILCGIDKPPRCFTDRVFSFGLALAGDLKMLPVLFSVREQATPSIPPHQKFCVMRGSSDPGVREKFTMLADHLNRQWQDRFGAAPGAAWVNTLFDIYCEHLKPQYAPPAPQQGPLQMYSSGQGLFLVRHFSEVIEGLREDGDAQAEFLAHLADAIFANFLPEMLMRSRFPQQKGGI